MTTFATKTTTAEATEALGEAIGNALQGGEFVGLVGDLGAGKTAFVRGVARGAGVPAEARVSSPTFAIVNEYAGGRVRVCHADLYRVRDAEELYDAGFYDLVNTGAALFVEWIDIVREVAPHDRLEVRIAKAQGGRTLTFDASGPHSERLLEAARAHVSRNA